MKPFIVETSARHVHVTQQDLETLFGAGYELHIKKMLSQPGQYASEERVDVVGPKKTLSGVSILGPVRSATQVEISLTDAEEMGVKDKDVVSVKLNTPERALTFGDVVVRVSDKFALAMHIDTDESNAACCGRDTMGEIVK